MKELLQTQEIYRSRELRDFLLSLETRYPIEDARERYHALVNFSANSAAPYHRWFIYREGFAGELIRELLRESGARPGEWVIDPFCGSGTTNVTAALAGYHTLGLDVNPMSAALTGAKVARYSREDRERALEALGELDRFREADLRPADREVEKYFREDHLRELLRIRTLLEALPPSGARTLLKTAFDSVILDCSDRKRDGNGLKVRPTRVTSVAETFGEKVRLILGDVAALSPPPGIRGYGLCAGASGLARQFSRLEPGGGAGTVIFSPPYANSFDYFESYKLELILGGYAAGMKGVRELRGKAVRSFIGGEAQESCDWYVDLIAREIEEAIPEKEAETGRRDARTRKVPGMLRGYFADMREILRQCALCLEPGRRAYIIVDQSAYLGKIVPTDLLLACLGEEEGFTVGRILPCRRARTSTQQLNRYPYLKTALRESVVELIKR